MTDNQDSHYREGVSSEKSEIPSANELMEENQRLRKANKQLKNKNKRQDQLITVLSSRATVSPDEFMNFDVFCQILGVNQREEKLLLVSLRTDDEFYETSERNRRLYGRTGITHLFKIREAVVEKVKTDAQRAKRSRK